MTLKDPSLLFIITLIALALLSTAVCITVAVWGKPKRKRPLLGVLEEWEP